MRRGTNPVVRCPECRLQRHVCVCALLPRLPTRTRVVLIIHQLETRKPTNTGRLALRCLTNSELAVRGRATGDEGGPATYVDTRAVPPWLATATRPVLLFPHEQASPIETFRGGEPVTLIVPDATWSQAARARKRIPGLDGIPCAALTLPRRPAHRLRHDPRPGHVSTLEALAHALGVLEGPAIEEALLRLHDTVVERTLWVNGRLPAGHVPAGVAPLPGPEGARTGPSVE